MLKGADNIMKKRPISLLFIGNSHTYYNNMPLMVKQRAEETGYDCRVVMIAHGGWFLAQHVKEPDVRFNIFHGNYDYVILQEHAHPFGPEEKFHDAVMTLCQWIRDAGSTPVICEIWAKRDEPEKQVFMNQAHQRAAQEAGALLAPIGEYWWGYMQSWPNLEMYAPDGAHASPAGSDFVAKYIWEEIRTDIDRKRMGHIAER